MRVKTTVHCSPSHSILTPPPDPRPSTRLGQPIPNRTAITSTGLPHPTTENISRRTGHGRLQQNATAMQARILPSKKKEGRTRSKSSIRCGNARTQRAKQPLLHWTAHEASRLHLLLRNRLRRSSCRKCPRARGQKQERIRLPDLPLRTVHRPPIWMGDLLTLRQILRVHLQ